MTDLVATTAQRGGQPSVTVARTPWGQPPPIHPLAPSQDPLALPNAASVAPRGPLTGTKWTTTYPL